MLRHLRQWISSIVIGAVIAATTVVLMAAWTSPRTWVDGEVLTASLLNTHLRDNLDYLKSAVDAKGYVLQGGGNADAFNPSDSTTYYFGAGLGLSVSLTTADIKRLYIPVAGTITLARVTFSTTGTLGSNNQSTVSIRLNNTTDTTLSAVTTQDAAVTSFASGALSVAVVAGDYIELKWVTPAWGTNPTAVMVTFQVFVRLS